VSSVRTVVHPGWIAVGGPEVRAVVAVGERRAEALEAAAAGGLVPLLEALTAHGLSRAPDFVACTPTPTGVRVVLRGAAVAVLPDGTSVDDGGRMPWLDFDLDVAPGAEVVLAASESEQPRGWRRPARLSRTSSDASAAEGSPGLLPEPEPEPESEPSPEQGTGAEVGSVPELPLVPQQELTPPPPSGDAVPWRRPGRTKELPPAGATEVFRPLHGPAPEASEAAEPELPASDPPPVVLAVLCPAGHPSPPHAPSCRTCGREVPPQEAVQTPRPSLGVLRISTGGSVPLDRGVLLGRAPRVDEELPPAQRPHLVRVGGGAERDISRNHAEVVLEGWHVLVRDLGSTNGTTVALPGQEPVRLRPAEEQGIEPGTVVTLAGQVVLTYEPPE
jgi:hypothetical protein